MASIRVVFFNENPGRMDLLQGGFLMVNVGTYTSRIHGPLWGMVNQRTRVWYSLDVPSQERELNEALQRFPIKDVIPVVTGILGRRVDPGFSSFDFGIIPCPAGQPGLLQLHLLRRKNCAVFVWKETCGKNKNKVVWHTQTLKCRRIDHTLSVW